jgi:hypothetical protein
MRVKRWIGEAAGADFRDGKLPGRIAVSRSYGLLRVE